MEVDFNDKIVMDGNVVMVTQCRWMEVDQLNPGALAKMWSDKADSLTFLSIPFRYSRRKKAGRFLESCYGCLRKKYSWRKWRKNIKEDRASIRKLVAELRTIEHFEKLHHGLQRDIKIKTSREAADESTYFFYTMRTDCQIENPNATGKKE